MAKTVQFKAYDLNRKNLHKIPSPPVKIHHSRLDRGEWSRATKIKPAKVSKSGKASKRRSRISKTSAAKRPPHGPIDVLRCVDRSETQCLHCGKFGDDPSCGIRCYREFKKQHFVADKIDIKGPGVYGYGAYTKPGVHIKKDQYLDEYIGDLRPINEYDRSTSLYIFEIPKTCAVDAEKAGNWTRFVNSHCRPNCRVWADFIGCQHVILFQALRDIGPEEEITFKYGKKYFEDAGLKCQCSAHSRK